MNKKTVGVLFLQAATGVFLFRVFLFLGLNFTSAVNSGLITSTSPALVGLLAFFILKEKPSMNRIIGITFVVAGLLIVNVCSSSALSMNNSSIIGNILILIAVTCEALFSILSKVSTTNIPALYRTTIITIFAVVCFIPFSIYDTLHFDFATLNFSAIMSVLYYGTFVSVLSYILWFKGISKVSASNAAVFTGVMPISSILLSCIVLKESILPSHLISLVFILIGICFSCFNNFNSFNFKKKISLP